MAAQLRELLQNPPTDDRERHELYEAARSLYLSLERPTDAFSRISLSCVLLPMTQIAIDIGILRALSESPSPLSAEDLAKIVKADATLLERILRYLGSFALILAHPKGSYSANETTRYLATPGKEGGIKHYFRNHYPIMQVLPDVLKDQGYRNPSDPLHTAFQVAHKTTLHAYSWTPLDPSVLVAFHNFLKSRPAQKQDWTIALDVDSMRLSAEEVGNGRVLFCDVGGGSGPQSISLRKTIPELAGRVIMQDQESVISKLDQTELQANKIEIQTHNFFEEQPVKGAKTYYLKHIMHDWPDVKCLEILARLKEAMAKGSQILIDEIVISDDGVSWKQAQADIQMMAALASMERSESQWHALLTKARLNIKSIVPYGSKDSGRAIITAVLP